MSKSRWTWEEARQLHRQAAEDLARLVERIPAEDWWEPRAEGKWSPAETVDHLDSTYAILLQELAGGPGMQLRAKPWLRLFLRLTLVPRILRGGGFPAGARAPRETRPEASSTDQVEAVAAFREQAARFEAAIDEAHAARPGMRLTHAYFGKAPLAKSVVLCARHIEHHHHQLVPLAAAAPG
jgi:uncharacterized damage-inducible protein DinB